MRKRGQAGYFLLLVVLGMLMIILISFGNLNSKNSTITGNVISHNGFLGFLKNFFFSSQQDILLAPVDETIFSDILRPGADFDTIGIGWIITSNNPYMGINNTEFKGNSSFNGGWKNARVSNLNISATGLDWNNSYLEFAIQTASPVDYYEVSLFNGSDEKYLIGGFTTSGSRYELMNIYLNQFSPSQSSFGNEIDDLMLGASWPDNTTVYIDEIRIYSPDSSGCSIDSDCDDGLFCNGEETCDTGIGTCISGTQQCTGSNETCDENNDICISSCTPNFQPQNTTCLSNETLTTYYIDSNSCGDNSNRPGNKTMGCDFDKNGLIGDFSDIDISNINPEYYVDGSLGNFSENFSGTRDFEFREGNITRVSFDWDFGNGPLNLDMIEIEQQSSSNDKGYIIVNNLSTTKTVKIDHKNSSTDSVCVKEAEVPNVGNLTQYCNGTSETLVGCPGSSNGITCSVESNNSAYSVTGISNSGIIEFLLTGSAVGCTPSWNCTGFSECVGGQKIRSCIDTNFCGNNLTKPAETQSCESPIGCVPNWDPGNWEPAECPSYQVQTRTVTDLNNCGTDTGKPPESRACRPETTGGNLKWLFWGLVLIIFLSIIVVGAIIFRLWTKENESSPSALRNTHLNYESRPYGENSSY